MQGTRLFDYPTRPIYNEGRVLYNLHRQQLRHCSQSRVCVFFPFKVKRFSSSPSSPPSSSSFFPHDRPYSIWRRHRQLVFIYFSLYFNVCKVLSSVQVQREMHTMSVCVRYQSPLTHPETNKNKTCYQTTNSLTG